MECALSQKPSFQYLYDDASIQIRTSPIDDYFTSHVCGFCVTFIGFTIRQPTRTSSYSSEEFLDDVISLKWRTMKTVFLRQWMFVHWKRNIRDIMRSHISRWTVKEAYTQADRDYDPVTAHEVRALSVSFMGVQLWPYLTSCQWRFGGHLVSSRIRIYVI